MALKRSNAELLIAKGIEQKVPDVIVPDESLSVAENVDFSKVGIARKRPGFIQNSNIVLQGGVLDEIRRLGVRQRREVLCITETTTSIGSAAGVGHAGDTLFSYSEETRRWIPRGKMPRPNLDILWTSGVPAAGNIGSNQQYVTGGVGEYVCVAYQASQYSTIRVVIFDIGGEVNGALRESPTIVIDTTFEPRGTYLAGWARVGGKVWLVYGPGPHAASGGANDFAAARAFRTETASFDSFETVLQGTSPNNAAVYSVSTDGEFIYTAHRGGTGGYEIRKYSGDCVLHDTITENGVVLNGQEIAIDARGSAIDVVRHDLLDGKVYISRVDKATMTSLLTNQFVTTGRPSSSGNAYSNLAICSVNDTDAVILWANQNTTEISLQPTYLSVGLMRMTTGALLGYFNHMGLVPYAQPFMIDGRVFFIAMHTSGLVRPNSSTTDLSGTQTGEESFMCFQIPLENMNYSNTPFPCAQWDFGNCVAKTSLFGASTFGSMWMNGKTIYQDGSGVYALTNIATSAGQSALDWLPAPRLTRLEFGDAAHRWRHEEFHDVAAFAGGVPFVYDGTRTYELSTALHQPIPLGWGVEAGGGLTADKQVFLRFAMLHVDGNGRECWSQPSRIVSVLPTGADLAAYAYVMPVTTTMRPDMGNGALGRMKLFCFAASENAPNEYKVAAPPVEIWPNTLDPVLFSIPGPLAEGNTEMYTGGFELDNYPAPPCRAMAVHSGRLFMIASDSNEVIYTKPFSRERGAECALGQAIPLPDKGTALASLNDRLAIFTHRSILVVGGDGPDATGSPPDAFSRPVLVTPDHGCIEYCAVGRTPLGVIFRGHQGFYLLDMGFDVKYIGGSVEDITARWTATRSIVHDQKASCCRVTGFNGDRSEELCFWYDTKRWSMNLLASDVVDSVALGDNLLVAMSDTSVGLGSRYRLGTREEPVSYQDFGESYTQVVETGWLSFQQSGVFKRVWRVYVMARAIDADATVRVEVWKDWESRVSSDREFNLVSQEVEPRNLRIHLKHQKLKAIKVRITVTSDGAGADIMKIGFELGMRTGGPKEVREQTQ